MLVKKFSMAAGAVLIVLGSTASLTDAHLPKTGNRTIVPLSSIAGVSLGEPCASAVKSWGKVKGDHCSSSATFVYTYGQSFEFNFLVRRGKVITINIEALAPLTRSEKALISKYRTPSGIHVGSTLSAVRAAYPNGSSPSDTLGLCGGGGCWTLSGPNGTSTTFWFGRSGGHERVEQIELQEP